MRTLFCALLFAYFKNSLYLCTRKGLNDMNENPLIVIFDSIRDSGFSAHTLQLIDNYTNDILHGRTNLMQASALQIRRSLGRTPYVATREQALNQVAFLLKAKQAAQATGK